MKAKEKKLYDKIMADPGAMIHRWEEKHKNAFVITGPHAFILKGSGLIRYIGRVVQIRQEAGMFGSDIVFLIYHDGITWTHENQFFYLVKDEYIPELDALYKDVPLFDHHTEVFTIKQQNPEIGFIIPSKIKDGEYTPMRELKSSIFNKLSDLGL